ncbi:hypothetical protein Aco04nite_12170 [Winogradskya consettensis]|uniref:Uncharacterized protein n=1 Tax=Winogradskya consettensis TaxID=113560 RepID=A0A919SBV7_9ACTN|nr:hypothetical protein Aco04nite_12170 [Actinoplanes consettensis]
MQRHFHAGRRPIGTRGDPQPGVPVHLPGHQSFRCLIQRSIDRDVTVDMAISGRHLGITSGTDIDVRKRLHAISFHL